jgi:hypothetical protein
VATLTCLPIVRLIQQISIETINMPKLSRIAPEVPVSNLREAVEYYGQKLGFRAAMEMPTGDYAIVERDGVAIHLFQDAAGSHSPAGMHIFTSGLDELHAELL